MEEADQLIVKIPITKAGNRPIEVNTDELPIEMYRWALEEGLKVLLNKGMSKITTKDLEGDALEEARDAAFKKGEDNALALMEGKMKRNSRTASADGKKVPGVVMTEARRLAKEVVKNEIRAAGMKVSHVEPAEITRAANEMIATDPSYIVEATKNIELRTAKVTIGEDENATKAAALAKLKKLGGIAVSPKLVAKADKAKAERKESLSAKQAGKPAPRKPKAEVRAAH